MKSIYLNLVWVLFSLLFSPSFAHADYGQRIELGAGLITTSSPSQTDFEVGIEYEDRMQAMLGAGGSLNYIFSSPGTWLVAVPEGFLHPLGGEWLISGAPLFEFGSGTGTHLGVKVGTRIPLPLGAFTIIPEVALDMINGGNIWVFGLGIQF